jgi:hypothetical protein
MSVLAPRLDVRVALAQCAERGYARVSRAIDERFRRALRREIDAGPFERLTEEFGAVRQQIDGFDIPAPMNGFPLAARLCHDLRQVVVSEGRGIRGLATWAPNQVGAARYVAGSIGITPHLDGRRYRRLVVVVTLRGRARFAVCGSRDPEDVVESWTAGPGDLVLMRGPGLAGARDGRPFHLVEGPVRGERLSLGVRMEVDGPHGQRGPEVVPR